MVAVEESAIVCHSTLYLYEYSHFLIKTPEIATLVDGGRGIFN